MFAERTKPSGRNRLLPQAGPKVKGRSMTSPVLVTGGTGRLGRSVVARLVDAKAGSPHFVQPSIVGIDAMAAWGYVKAKLGVERIVENSGLPWTVLRVTQFYSYCFENSRKLAKFPLVAPVPSGFRVQPVDSREVAARLVELALGEPVGRAPDMSGPEISSWADLFRSYLAATHQRKLVVPVPVPGSKAVRNGALLPPPGHTEGVRTWDQFLDEQLPERRGGPDPAARVKSA
jgi:uncharacterized protein YbjT (DUF2867 family)